MNAYLGSVVLIVGSLAPTGSRLADGAVLTIASNIPLFSLYGNQFGGNGTSTFALPNLTAIAPVGMNYVVCTGGLFPTFP